MSVFPQRNAAFVSVLQRISFKTEAVMQQQIPVRLDGFPASGPDSRQFLCSQVLSPRQPFNCIFEVLVDPTQAYFGPFLPLCNFRLPLIKTICS